MATTLALYNDTDLYSSLRTTDATWGNDTLLNTSIVYSNITSNTTSKTTETDQLTDYMEYNVAKAINEHYLYFIVGIGIPGNVAALITLFHMRPLSSSLLYMTVLAISDIVSLSIKICYLRLANDDIRIYDFGCKITFFLATFSVHFSNWILVAMTVERFIAIWFPLRVSEWCTKKRAAIVMAVMGLLLAGLNLHFFWILYESPHDFYVYFCNFYSQYGDFIVNAWNYIDAAAYSFIPVGILLVFNCLIVVGIIRSGKTQRKLINQADKEKLAEKAKQQRQIAIMLVTVSIFFVILTSPNVIFFIVREKWDYNKNNFEFARYYLVYQIVYVLSDSNHAVNFYLYFLSGRRFRQKFLSIICFCKSQDKSRFSNAISTRKLGYSKQSTGYTNSGYSQSQSNVNDITSSQDNVPLPSTSEKYLAADEDAAKRRIDGHI